MPNLFGQEEKTTAQKTKASRKATGDLTRWAINFMNDSMQFKVHRSNNIPSPIIKRSKEKFDAFDNAGNPVSFPYEKVEIMFKKGNIKERILDISGIVLPYNGNNMLAGKHIEIEVKRGKDKLSPEQTERIDMIKKAGGISFVFDSEESFRFQIKQFMIAYKLPF